MKYLSRLNLLRMLSTDRQAEEELENQEGSDGQDEPANVSLDGSLMDFEQELLNYSDIMPCSSRDKSQL